MSNHRWGDLLIVDRGREDNLLLYRTDFSDQHCINKLLLCGLWFLFGTYVNSLVNDHTTNLFYSKELEGETIKSLVWLICWHFSRENAMYVNPSLLASASPPTFMESISTNTGDTSIYLLRSTTRLVSNGAEIGEILYNTRLPHPPPFLHHCWSPSCPVVRACAEYCWHNATAATSLQQDIYTISWFGALHIFCNSWYIFTKLFFIFIFIC